MPFTSVTQDRHSTGVWQKKNVCQGWNLRDIDQLCSCYKSLKLQWVSCFCNWTKMVYSFREDNLQLFFIKSLYKTLTLIHKTVARHWLQDSKRKIWKESVTKRRQICTTDVNVSELKSKCYSLDISFLSKYNERIAKNCLSNAHNYDSSCRHICLKWLKKGIPRC